VYALKETQATKQGKKVDFLVVEKNSQFTLKGRAKGGKDTKGRSSKKRQESGEEGADESIDSFASPFHRLISLLLVFYRWYANGIRSGIGR